MNDSKNIAASEIMSTKLIVLHPKDKLARAKEIFKQYDIHHIPVAVMGEVKGIISLGDLLFLEGLATNTFDEFIQAKRHELVTVDEIMTPRPYCLPEDALLAEVLDLMLDQGVNCVLLKNKDSLSGMLTSQDMMKYLRTIINN